MSLTDWEKLQAFGRTLRGHAEQLGRWPDYDPRVVRLIQAFDAIADLAECGEKLPAEDRLAALVEILSEEIERLP